MPTRCPWVRRFSRPRWQVLLDAARAEASRLIVADIWATMKPDGDGIWWRSK